MRPRRLSTFAPAVLLAAGGCLASKSDIRLLQDQLASMQSTQTRADSLHRLQADSTLRLIAKANDSIRVLSSHLTNFQAQTTGDLYDMGRQLITIQELTGQNQRRVQELRATLEQRNETAAASAPAPAPGDSTRPAGPGPAVLFQAGTDQMARGSYSAARTAFQDLLTHYPNYDDAGAAQYYVGLSFEREQNHAAADSVYQLVASKYPKSPRAPTALYKFAQSQHAQGHDQTARAALNRILQSYPNSDEVGLARDLLRTIK